MQERMRLYCNCVLYLADFKVVNVCLETIRGSHLNGEKVMVVLLELLAGGVLSQE